MPGVALTRFLNEVPSEGIRKLSTEGDRIEQFRQPRHAAKLAQSTIAKFVPHHNWRYEGKPAYTKAQGED